MGFDADAASRSATRRSVAASVSPAMVHASSHPALAVSPAFLSAAASHAFVAPWSAVATSNDATLPLALTTSA